MLHALVLILAFIGLIKVLKIVLPLLATLPVLLWYGVTWMWERYTKQ